MEEKDLSPTNGIKPDISNDCNDAQTAADRCLDLKEGAESGQNPPETIVLDVKEGTNSNQNPPETIVKKNLPRSEKKKLKRLEKMMKMKESRKDKKENRKRKLDTGSDNKNDDRNTMASVQDNSCSTTLGRNEGMNSEADIGHIPKKERLALIKRRCIEAMELGQKICIDCSLESHMTQKECSKLAQQIGRLYGSNRKCEKPAHIYLTGLDKNGEIYKECVRKNSGFENYLLDILSEDNLEVVFGDKNDIIYLSPDSDNVLESLDPDKVYVIGGLIDETVRNNITMKTASDKGVSTARLPIDEYMEKGERISDSASFNKILAVNQVFDILLTLGQSGDWRTALEAGVPKRTGFVLKEPL